jgi:transcriptional regulator with XRE-family HTH domain
MEKTIYTREYGVMLRVLRDTREQVPLTQIELASKLNVTQVFVSKCEGGQRRLDLIELRAWCAAMGVSTSDFLKEVEVEIANLHMQGDAPR